MRRSKALLPYNDATFIESVVEVLESVFRDVMIISDDPSLSAGTRARTYPDIFKDCGPLAGIHSALLHASTNTVFVCPTDMPLIGPEDVQGLLAAASPDRITIACEGERWHPLFGVYPVHILPELEMALRNSKLRIRDVIKGCTCGYALYSVGGSSAGFININTPDEYQDLIRGDAGSTSD
jgi:molybdopterin-guanine dinucleotide biosynthesis protein A